MNGGFDQKSGTNALKLRVVVVFPARFVKNIVPSNSNAYNSVSMKGGLTIPCGWRVIDDRDIQVLRDFCGGIATVPANTATVESDIFDFGVVGR